MAFTLGSWVIHKQEYRCTKWSNSLREKLCYLSKTWLNKCVIKYIIVYLQDNSCLHCWLKLHICYTSVDDVVLSLVSCILPYSEIMMKWWNYEAASNVCNVLQLEFKCQHALLSHYKTCRGINKLIPKPNVEFSVNYNVKSAGWLRQKNR